MNWTPWLPPKERTADLVLTVVFAGIVAIYFHYIDGKRQEEISFMQQDMDRLAHAMSEPAIATALLSYLGCANTPEIRESAIKLLAQAAPTVANQHMRSAIKACNGETSVPGTDISVIEEMLANNANARIFTREVKFGRDFYKDKLWKNAADQWYAAMSDLPQSYIDNKIIKLSEVNIARAAYEDMNYVAAADFYARAYRDVATAE